MKYFIDFEATQFSKEIISIGCYREDGEVFYSLVAPKNMKKLTNFITNLTGITAEMLENAPSSEKVFSDFSDWILDNDNDPKFYVWGDSDSDFLWRTSSKSTSLKAKLIMNYVASSLIDYSKIFEKKYCLYHTGLIKIINCFYSDITQTHNALDDAILLFNVFSYEENHIAEDIIYKLSSLPDTNKILNQWNGRKKVEEENKEIYSLEDNYVCNDGKKWSKCNYPKNSICVIKSKNSTAEYVFPNLDVATSYIYKKVLTDLQRNSTTMSKVRKSIKQAYGNNNRYINFLWRKVV